jgi:hypothetical protein
MRRSIGLACVALALAAGAVRVPSAQQPAQAPPTWMPDIKFASGREVVPYLEGWLKNSDGSFDFVFGYYNRNQEQDLVIPAGPDNAVSPGPADQGQPTYFMAKRQPRIFRVRVPKDFGDKSLTWTITANGHTEKVVAKLVPAYEKDERFIETNNNTTIELGQVDTNKPPTIAVAPVAAAGVNAPVTLTAMVTDDGLPKPKTVRFDDPDRPQQEPAAPNPLDRFKSQRNTNGPQRISGLRVNWQVYRGTGKVALDALVSQVTNGKGTTTVRFSAPGTYTLIATAGDGKLVTSQRFTVDVK